MRTHRWLVVLLAFGAFSVAGCETEQTEETPATAEDMDAAGAEMAAETPPPGTYMLVGGEGFGEEGMPEGLVLDVQEADWSSNIDGEQDASGTYVYRGDTLHVNYETGDCAGIEALYTWEWDGELMTLHKVESAACESGADRTVFELQDEPETGEEM